jgi:hypothetical protein
MLSDVSTSGAFCVSRLNFAHDSGLACNPASRARSSMSAAFGPGAICTMNLVWPMSRKRATASPMQAPSSPPSPAPASQLN